jgi:pilus assembly protein CpaC
MIDALERNNLSRVLAQPNLVAISGQEATFLAGGEFPIPVPQAASTGGTTITIEYKEFGVRLKFVPIILGDGRIRLKVAPEVSDLDYANGVELSGFSIPAVTVRSLNTTVEMAEGQTLALGGLLNERVSATRSNTPGLGNLPIIGTLFRSVRYERSETELLVLVTPVFTEAMKPAQVPAGPGEHWRDPNDVELYFNGKLGTDGGDKSKTPSNKAVAGPAPRYLGAYGYRDASVIKSEPKTSTPSEPTATPQPGTVMEPAPQASVEPVSQVFVESVTPAPVGSGNTAVVEVTPVLSE